jgi:hypothetical protein
VTDWVSLRELDERLGLAKGAAFRAFKRAGLTEGRDFRVLDATRDAAEIAQLRARDRIWRSSVNVVLLSPRAAARVAAALRGPA